MHDLGFETPADRSSTVSFKWPYALLVHHYDELAQWGNECRAKAESELCVRERDASAHVQRLLAFLDEQIMSEVRAEQRRNEQGLYTFEYAWVGLKPGKTSLVQFITGSEWEPAVVHSIQGGAFADVPASAPMPDWEIRYWNLQYDGEYLRRFRRSIFDGKFDGEKKMDGNTIFVDEDLLEDEERYGEIHPVIKKQIEVGERYWQLLRKQCKYYKGRTSGFPFNEVSAAGMT
jgi:hypothetical protein